MILEFYKLKEAFKHQRFGAKTRRIKFLLTFDEWLSIWIKSKKLDDRGVRTGQYVMSRFGDMGPYAVGNVRIVSNGENIREAHVGKTLSEYTKGLIRNSNIGKSYGESTKEKHREAMKGNKYRLGIPHNDESRKNMREAAKTKKNDHRKGVPVTDSARKNMSEAGKRRWAAIRAQRDGM